MDVALKISAILAFVGLNAFFVAAEFALVGARTTRLHTLAAAGDRKARLALKAIERLDDYISSTQLGITLASLALGWIGEATLATLFAHLFHGLPPPLSALASHAVAGTLAFACITCLHIILGELAPKSVALLHPEQVSRLIIHPLVLFTYVFWPAIWLLNASATAFLRLFAIRPPSHAERVHAPEELLLLVSESRKHGLVADTPAQMIAGVLDLSHTRVRELMTPRTEIVAVERHWSFAQIVETVRRSGHSRLPVYEEDLDHIVGLLLAKDLLDFCTAPEAFDLEQVMREPFFVPATMPVDKLLRELQRRSVHLAIVVDEYGGTLGLITLEDLLEEIVGDIFDEFDRAKAQEVQATADGRLLVPGDLPVAELNERYHLHLPEGGLRHRGRAGAFGARAHPYRRGGSAGQRHYPARDGDGRAAHRPPGNHRPAP
ncbi:MAG: membrane protein [Candidatus Tectimicrobiota bacterium]|nr:MAG: membrane protein [Candidatus Tectomicrobia bacterium]